MYFTYQQTLYFTENNWASNLLRPALSSDIMSSHGIVSWKLTSLKKGRHFVRLFSDRFTLIYNRLVGTKVLLGSQLYFIAYFLKNIVEVAGETTLTDDSTPIILFSWCVILQHNFLVFPLTHIWFLNNQTSIDRFWRGFLSVYNSSTDYNRIVNFSRHLVSMGCVWCTREMSLVGIDIKMACVSLNKRYWYWSNEICSIKSMQVTKKWLNKIKTDT